MKQLILLVIVLTVSGRHMDAFAEIIRLNSIADIWLSDATVSERDSSAGKNTCFKLKSIQEMGAIRFDVTPVKGKKIESVKLYLRIKGRDMLRHIRVSTISQSWEEGTARWPYSRGNGATFNHANAADKKPWAFPGSQFCDVIMGNGNTITTYDEIKRIGSDWLSIDLTHEIIYAMITNSTDGLAVMDGGTILLFNNFVYSSDKKDSEPYIEVEVADLIDKTPALPEVKAIPAYEHANIETGSIMISVNEKPDVFCWNIKLNGEPVDRWKIPFPRAIQKTGLEQEHLSARSATKDPINFILRDLIPEKEYELEVVAINCLGTASSPAIVHVKASPERKGTPKALPINEPQGPSKPLDLGNNLAVWAVPDLATIDPLTSRSIHSDLAGRGDGHSTNSVWNGKEVTLHGAKGEYVSFQIVMKRKSRNQPVAGIKVIPNELRNGSSCIGVNEYELFNNWYSRPGKDDRWYPAFNIPLKSDETIRIPDAKRGLNNQENQTVLVDIYIPGNSDHGIYRGSIDVEQGESKIALPIVIKVYDFSLPDKLSFWCEFNCYNIPRNHIDYHRLAHQNRCVFNPWRYQPLVKGTGKALTLGWNDYDRQVGPLLSGEAFENNRRSGVPTPVMYLPFEDSWPTCLTKSTYKYNGPWVSLKGLKLNRNDPVYRNAVAQLNEHYLKSDYIGKSLSRDYQEGFARAVMLFAEHFKTMGWNQTEMQCFYGGKKTHRIDYGSEMWWQTDEPFHWDDWLALQFFDNLWTKTISKHSCRFVFVGCPWRHFST
ncbi:MAG: hypothetical protein MRK02_15465 [Candidatus Scalindua sp.]|nr:hypothetical protein [Candidatus Scalindua sp.]